MILVAKVVLITMLFAIAWVMVMGIISMILRHKERKMIIENLIPSTRVIPDTIERYIRDLFK